MTPFDPARVAESVGELVAAEPVRGGVTMSNLRRMLRWALSRARAKVEAAQVTREQGWGARAEDQRLRAVSLRHTTWAAVFDRDGADPVARATGLIVAALAVREELASPSCPVRLREHVERHFGTTLLPGRERFEVHRGTGRHVIVGVAGALRAVDVLDAAGAVRDPQLIAGDLRACLEASVGAPPPPVLALTGRTRPEAASTWSAIRRASPEAAALLREALFSVFFDPATPPDVDTCGRLAQAGPPGNRCYWHAMQLVVFGNGDAAIVGSFIAGIVGEGALALCARLGAARSPGLDAPVSRVGPTPPLLQWTVDLTVAKALALASRTAAVNAGGLLVVAGFGRTAWAGTGVSPEHGVVLALRLAFDMTIPDLDELEGMVNMRHVLSGVVMRIGTTTPEMRAFLLAARSPEATLGPEVAAAIVAQRTNIRQAKALLGGESALEVCLFALGGLPRLVRGALAIVVQWLQLLLAWRTPPGQRKDLHQPVVAVDSSAPFPPGLAAVGRFGVLAPPRSIWIHHSVDETDVRFVIQLGPDHVARAGELRQAIPLALARVLAAARTRSPPAPTPPFAPPTSRLAYRRILFLGAALRGPHHHG